MAKQKAGFDWSQFDAILGPSSKKAGFDWSQFDAILGPSPKKAGFDWEAFESKLGPQGRLVVETSPEAAMARVGAPPPKELPSYTPQAREVLPPPEIEVASIPGKHEAKVAKDVLVRAGKAAATAIPDTAEIVQKNREKQLWSLATKAMGRRLSEPEFQAILQADRERDPFYRTPPAGFWTKENLADVIGTAVGFGPLGLASMAGAETGLAARMALGAGENLLFAAPQVAATARDVGAKEALTEAAIMGGVGALLGGVAGRRGAPRVDVPEEALSKAAAARVDMPVPASPKTAEPRLDVPENPVYTPPKAAEVAAPARVAEAPAAPAAVEPPAEGAKRMVTVYQGEGAAGGAGADPRWWSTDPKRAASFGRVKAVEVPEEAIAAGQAEARRLGSGTKGDVVLPDELTRGARETDIEPDVYDLTMEPETPATVLAPEPEAVPLRADVPEPAPEAAAAPTAWRADAPPPSPWPAPGAVPEAPVAPTVRADVPAPEAAAAAPVRADVPAAKAPAGETEIYGGLPLPKMLKFAKDTGKAFAKVYERTLAPFGRAVSKYGAAGRELAQRANIYRESFERKAGSAVARVDKLIKSLNDAEWAEVVNAMETGTQAPGKLNTVARQLSSILDDVYREARSLGWDIGYIQNYFPHMYEQMSPEMTAALAKAGALDPRTGKRLMLPERAMSANLEFSRQLHNTPGWRTDKNVIRDYLMDAYDQLAQIRAFGKRNADGSFTPGKQLEHAYDLAAEMGRYGRDAEDLGREFVERLTGQRAPDTGAKYMAAGRKVTAILSLSMSALSQAAQLHTVPGFTGARNFFKAMKDVMVNPARYYNRALEAGATIPALRSELANVAGGGGVSGFMWGAPTIDKLGRVVAERSGELFAESLQRSGKTEALAELLQAAGRKYTGKLSDADLLAVGKYIADTTQLRATTENLPAFWSSELGRTVFQFGHFMYGMTRLHAQLGERAVKAARAGDWGAVGRAIKPFVGMMISGAVFGEILNDVRAFLGGMSIELPSRDDLMGRPEELNNKVLDELTTRMQSSSPRSSNLIIRTLQNLSYAGTIGLPQYLLGRLEDIVVEGRPEQVAPSLSKAFAVGGGIKQGFKGRAKAFGQPIGKGPMGALVGGLRRGFTITKMKPFGIPLPGFEITKPRKRQDRDRMASRRIRELEARRR
jgi:hypothetical protein